MAIITKEELLKSFREKLSTSDEDLVLLENITDTVNDMESRAGEDWKKKFEDNDKAWRERYKARFSDPVKVEEEKIPLPVEEHDPAPGEGYTLNDLFE